jgi:hypothetical protein
MCPVDDAPSPLGDLKEEVSPLIHDSLDLSSRHTFMQRLHDLYYRLPCGDNAGPRHRTVCAGTYLLVDVVPPVVAAGFETIGALRDQAAIDQRRG